MTLAWLPHGSFKFQDSASGLNMGKLDRMTAGAGGGGCI